MWVVAIAAALFEYAILDKLGLPEGLTAPFVAGAVLVVIKYVPNDYFSGDLSVRRGSGPVAHATT